MKRTIYQMPKAGSIGYLSKVDDHLPDPAPDEVQIEVRAIGLNFADIFAMFGIYSATPKGTFIPGLEYAGTVVKKGRNVIFLNEGQAIMGVTRFGAYASHLNINANYVVPLPEEWNFEEGASFIVQAITAYYSLVPLGDIKQSQTVLIHSAAGGVGIWANRIAKQYNAYTIGSVGSNSKTDFAYKEGYDHVLVRGKNFEDGLTEILKDRPLHLVLECIGGSYQRISFDQLAPMGRMVVYGAAQYASPTQRPNYFKMAFKYLTRPKIDPQSMIQQNRSVMAFNLIWLYENHELMIEMVDELLQLEIGKPYIGHLFDFDNLPEAIRLFQSGNTIGKVVVKI